MDASEELMHIRMMQTEEHLLKKLDKIFHAAEDDGRCLTASELDDVVDIWKALEHMYQVKTHHDAH